MKILLPIDGSGAANEAVEFVRSLAKDNSIDAVVLMVSYTPPQYSMQPWIPDWTEHETQRVETILAKAKESLESNCRSVTLVHQSGLVVPCILDQAKSIKADMIVLGAKGHSAIHRVLLGSVSDSVATRAECSVVVVRHHEKKTNWPDKILLAFDKSIASREAVAELMECNMSRDTKVSVVSVAQNPYLFVGDGYEMSPIVLTLEETAPVSEAAERMASQIAEHFPHTQSHSPIADHVGDAIVHTAENDKAALIIVGDAGHSLIGEFFLGSTSRYVLRHAPCSVWISRHHWKSTETKKEATDDITAV